MQKKLVINIPNPCDEDWTQMVPDHTGRFCSHCQKTVIDFTTWNDTELYRFLKGRKEKVCGRFRVTQLKRVINMPPQPQSRLYRMAIALGLTLVFSNGAVVSAYPRAPWAFSKHKHQKKTGADTTFLKGLVYSNTGLPIKGAKVMLMKGAKVNATGLTDSTGAYNISDITAGNYSLLIECKGYYTNRRDNIKLPDNSIQRDTLTITVPWNGTDDTSYETFTGLIVADTDSFSYEAPSRFAKPEAVTDTIKPAGGNPHRQKKNKWKKHQGWRSFYNQTDM